MADVKQYGVGTVRKLARSISKYAMGAAKHFTIYGNKHRAYKLQNPGASEEELIYASDFNTFSDDPAIPENVKAWLLVTS